ncbi:hypothetical protein D6792_00165 [Candidatus Parcubacteria bacterium]|nr:MAG: hypothetical protein D6792_00165 [Candidatus Parcubacteria bacterium]
MLEGCREIREIEIKLVEVLTEQKPSLISELTLTEEDMCLLKQVVSNHALAAVGSSTSSVKIEDIAPLVFSCYLVVMGVENYDEGTFWKAIEKALGRSGPQWQKRWGEVFLETLKKNHLSVFYFQGAHKYVSQILAHGGIPDSCLQDFFEKLLWPTVNGTFDADPGWAEEIIAEWRLKPSLYQSTDRPVRRFIESGGKTAADFLARCIEMARIAYDEEMVPQASELGLPIRVVERFKEWLSERRDLKHSKRNMIFRRPVICLDDYGEVQCILPEQILNENSETKELRCRIVADEHELFSEQIPSYKRQKCVHTEERRFYLPPAKKYEVILQGEAKRLREWSFEGMHSDKWMAFDEGRRLITAQELPRDKLWVVVPDGMVFNPEVQVLERIKGTGHWDDYAFWCVDTSEAENLYLCDSLSHKKKLPLRSEREPYLDGTPLPSVQSRGLPVYAGRLPGIVIPLASSDEISRWDLFVEYLSDSAAKQKKCLPLRRVIGSKSDGNSAVVSLEDEQLIGKVKLGIYRVKARGPLGRDKQFDFAFVQQLEYEFDRQIYLEGDEVNLTLLIDPLCELESSKDETKVSGNNGVFEVVSSNCLQALELNLKLGEIELPLTFDIPCLRWALRNESRSFSWRSDSIEIQIEELEASEMSLRVWAPLPSGSLAELCLDGTSHAIKEEIRNGRVQFHLRQFLDSLRGLGKPLACFSLRFPGTPLGNYSLCPLQVRTCWTVESFDYEHERTGGVRTLILGWRDKGCVRNRRLRLWDLWRPWREPATFDIPDGKSELEIELPVYDFPAGMYRAEFYVEDEYCTRQRSLFVPSVNAMVFDIQIEPAGDIATEGSLFQSWLTHRLAGRDRAFDSASMQIGLEDAECLIHTMVVDREKAKSLWRAMPGTISQTLQNYLREVIKCCAEKCRDDEKALLLEVCKLCRICDQSLIPFKPGTKVRFEGKTAEYRGIRCQNQEDFIWLKYSDSERGIPLRHLDELSPENDDAPLSKLEPKGKTRKGREECSN